MTLLHSSKRPPPPLEDADYDHEISLVDDTKPGSAPGPTASTSRSPDRPLSAQSDSDSRRHSDVPLHKKATPERLRKEYTKRKYRKYQDRKLGEGSNGNAEDNHNNGENGPIGQDEEAQRGRPKTAKSLKPESVIDILYENERGGFLCGFPLFSSRALGNLDPAPWTNIAQKTSATNISNAQVPDPSWEWAWKDWVINHSEEVDQDGWEYSFMFSKKFSWHSASWWNSFVRRRAWIRKRIKRHTGYVENEAHMLTSDYFTIHSAQVRSTSRGSSFEPGAANRHSVYSVTSHNAEEEFIQDDICDINSLMKALKLARIDREKTEAVESFIEHGGDDLCYLKDRMHDIMRMFIFQASRQSLLAHLLKICNEAAEQQKENKTQNITPDKKSRLENLEAAVKAADEEVKKLEFWSDVKHMAEEGLTKGAVDESQGWDERWVGLDVSGPKDVISEQKLPGSNNTKENEEEGFESKSELSSGKGKEKAKETE